MSSQADSTQNFTAYLEDIITSYMDRVIEDQEFPLFAGLD